MAPEIFHHYLKNHFIFSKLTSEQVQFIYPSIKFRSFKKGEHIFFEKTPGYLYLVLHGKIKLMDSSHSEDFLVKDILYSGEFFGDVFLLGSAPSNEFAEVLINNTIACYCPVSAIRDLILMYPDLALQFATYAGLHLKKTQKRYFILGAKDAEIRLVYFLRQWAKAEGEEQYGKIFLERFLTLAEIAEYIFTSRQTVHTLFKRFKKKGYVQWNKKQLIVDPMLWENYRYKKKDLVNSGGL
jgi:CRP/FNR family transcriptional regulator, cyclic AMP receptor protein